MINNDAKKVSPLVTPALSPFSKKVYASAAFQWKGIGALYTLGVIVVSWMLVIPKITSDIGRAVDGAKDAVVENLPAFEIKGGEFQCKGEMPIVIGDEEKGDVAAIIDTRITDPGSDIKPVSYPFVLVTADRLIYFKNPVETRIMNFSDFPDFTVNEEQIKSIASSAKTIMPAIALVFIIPLSYITAILKILLLSGSVGIASAAVMSKSWSFSQLCRISAVAVTPSLFIRTFAEMAGVGGGVGTVVFLVSIALTIFFTIFGVSVLVHKQRDHAVPL